MEDIASKITQLLNDPQGMENIKSMAQSFLSENNITLPDEKSKQDDGIDMAQMTNIMSMLSKFNNQQNDDRTNLLLALRPHLSDRRKERLDKALKLIKLYSFLPLIQQSGLIDF